VAGKSVPLKMEWWMSVKQYANEKVELLFKAKLQLGIKLLLCFVAVYAIFVSLHVFMPELLAEPVAGISLGLVLGVCLIASTAIMALIFHLLSSRIERSFAEQLQRAVTAERK